ncbi:hypothetical protein [Companilactobacillus formosensis]|uniref:hypothetical protein n=1 Tax=Companilactobacillus formosensis TaxID=1617889 RepID=UPI0014769371|nr:hypothetical protein [Companilactobacillus formosensis]
MAGTLPTQLEAFAKPKFGQSLQDWSYSKQQVAKNNLVAEPSQGFCSRLDFNFYLDRVKHILLK